MSFIESQQVHIGMFNSIQFNFYSFSFLISHLFSVNETGFGDYFELKVSN